MTKVLELALLGGPRIVIDGEPLSNLKSSKAQALLCYLAVTGRPHSRQALASLLWGELPLADGRRNLRGVLLQLRQYVEPFLVITNQSLAFDFHADHWLDVKELKHRLASRPGEGPSLNRLQEAVELYQGEFLEDLHVRNAPAFDEWVVRQRTQLRELALSTCHTLAVIHAERKEYSAGIIHARRMLKLDPVHEQGWQHLMRLLTLSGHRNTALSEYENCRKVLDLELGVLPSPETMALAEQIRSGELSPRVGNGPLVRDSVDRGRAPSAASPVPAYSELPPFVAGPPLTHPGHFFGRQRELTRLFNMLQRLPLQNAAIMGPRRSGKTSLLHYIKNITTAHSDQLRPSQRKDWLSQPSRYRWVFVDFQDPRLGNMEAFLRYLLTQMALPVPEPCHLEDFLDVAIDGLHAPTVILLDEIGVALQRYHELDDAFWESLRSLATNLLAGNLSFILAGAEPPDELARHSGFGSPFFNIFGYTATLGPLSEQESRALIASSPRPFPAEDVEWILEKSGRWPILLQVLCRERLLALEEAELGAGWREEALRQMVSFERVLAGSAN